MAFWYTDLSLTALYMAYDIKTMSFLRRINGTVKTLIGMFFAALSTIIRLQYGSVFKCGDYECCFENPNSEFIFFGWIFLSITVHLILLFSVLLCKRPQSAVPLHTICYVVLANIIAWILPVVFFLLPKTRPAWLIKIHELPLLCSGFLNTALWRNTKGFTSVFAVCYCKWQDIAEEQHTNNFQVEGGYSINGSSQGSLDYHTLLMGDEGNRFNNRLVSVSKETIHDSDFCEFADCGRCGFVSG